MHELRAENPDEDDLQFALNACEDSRLALILPLATSGSTDAFLRVGRVTVRFNEDGSAIKLPHTMPIPNVAHFTEQQVDDMRAFPHCVAEMIGTFKVMFISKSSYNMLRIQRASDVIAVESSWTGGGDYIWTTRGTVSDECDLRKLLAPQHKHAS